MEKTSGKIEFYEKKLTNKEGQPLKSPLYVYKINGLYYSGFEQFDAIVGDYVEAEYEINGNFKNLKTMKKTTALLNTSESGVDWLAKEEREFRAKLINTLIMAGKTISPEFVKYCMDIVFQRETSEPLIVEEKL